MKVWIVLIFLHVIYAFPVGEVINKVVKSFAHDEQCFTQGLAVDNNLLYESCGLYGKSSLRTVDLNTGKVRHKIALARDLFAEGICIVDDVVYLLTWKNKKMFMFHKSNFKYLGVRRYQTFTGEGWGLTTDGKHLIVSDGSETISFFKLPVLKEDDANDGKGDEADILEEVFRFKVYDPITTRHITQINELEYHKENIYANIWYKDAIIRINATTGRISERYDASKLYPRSVRSPTADCLNGIAYDPNDDTMILTGKKWPKYYKVNFTEMEVRRSMEL
jgi:glutaminyl-peptide cyclotransferase